MGGCLFICVRGRGRRLPVAIILRFDRVGRRESVSYGIMTYISFDWRGGRGRPPLRNEAYIAFGCRGWLSSADSVKSQNDCHRQSATPKSCEMLIKLCGYPYQNQNNFIEFIARSPAPSAAPGRQCKYFIFF